MPHRLRRKGREIFGLFELQGRDLARARIGNRQVRSALRIIRSCISTGTNGYLENPRSSLIWHVLSKALKKFLSTGEAKYINVDMCMYGVPWKKPTRILAFGPWASSISLKTCHGRGTCDRTHRPHEQLSSSISCSYGVKNGKWRTSFAQVYPVRFVNDLLKHIK